MLKHKKTANFAPKDPTQNPVVAIPCRFDPDQRHHIKRTGINPVLFIYCCFGGGVRGDLSPSFVNLLANFCRGFPFTGFGNPRRIATGENLSFFVMVPTARGRTRQLACRRSSICLQIFAEGSRLRDPAITCGYRPASHNIRIQR